jgi:DNA repair exonuclease SbcCD nuclease subunit
MALKAGLNLKTDVDSINEQIAKHFVFPQLKNPDPAHDSLLIFHASIFGMDMGESKCVAGVDFTLNPNWLTGRGFDHIVGGHFHRRQEVDGIHYVGSMERQTFGEKDNPTGWMLIDGKKHEFIELETPMRFVELEFDFTDEFQQGATYLEKVIRDTYMQNAAVKVKYRMRKNDPFDRARLMRDLYAAGALSVVMEAEYVEEIQFRTQEIKAGQDILTQFKIWKDVNVDKDADGELESLLMREVQNGFPADVEKSYLTEIMNGVKK